MIAKRLRKLRKDNGLNQEQMAEIMGITRRSYGLYEKGERSPTAARLHLVAAKLPVSLDWLISNTDEAANVSSQPMHTICLEACDIRSWFVPKTDKKIQIAKPYDLTDTEAFAVVANGGSLIPEGIKDGYVCICSPQIIPQNGDVIFIKERNGRAGLRVLKGADEQWLNVESYLPPDEDGERMVYTERRKVALIESIATVVYVKRKV